MVTVNELFAGIGTQLMALENSNFDYQLIGFSEIDKKATKAHNLFFGTNTIEYGDITKIERLEYADLWTYSFPCQDISTMWYKKENPESLGKRSVLLFEVKRLLLQALNNNTLPKYLMLENVKNLLSNKYKGYFLGWVQFLNEIGYNTYYSIENAKYHGVPQHRERVFAISIRKDVDNHKFDFYRSGDSGIRIKDILEHDVSDKYNLDERYIDSVIIDKNNTINKNEIISIGTVEAYNYLSLKKICSINGISPTIPCRQPLNWIYDYNENRIRSLTPKETWRSMGIKDRYFDIVENEFSNSTLYSLAGNAIAVNVMTNIFNKLFE